MQLVISFFLKSLIFIYRIVISPFTVASCRFQPTCSNFALEALKKHTTLKAIGLIVRRISRCHPWGGYGHDPVIKTNKHENKN